MNKIKRIKSKIEERIALAEKCANAACEKNLHNTLEANELLIRQYKSLLDVIDSISEEKPSKDLEEEVKRYYSDNFTYISSDQPTLSILTNVARHFAEWQKERMIKDAKEIITVQRSLTEPEFVKQRVIFLKEG